MYTKKLLLAALLVVTATMMAPAARAFHYAGQAWCCDTVFYHVNATNPSSACGDLIVGPWFEQIIDAAANVWNAEGTMFQLVNVGNTSTTCITSGQWPGVCHGAQDGQNTISMATSCGWTDPSVIAFSTWWFNTTTRCITESDICFNDDVTWFNDLGICSGSCYDLLSVAEHEIGHWIASNHENDVGAIGYQPIMYFAFNFCQQRRVVTADDRALLDWAYGANDVIAMPSRSQVHHEHPDPGYTPPPPHDPCDPGPCPAGPAFCDSTVWDPCLLVCPNGDEVFTVTVKDSCGNPVCDPGGTFLDFGSCPTVPCPGSHPSWPIVFPDSCDAATGIHYFSVKAGMNGCLPCEPVVNVAGVPCGSANAKFFDTGGPPRSSADGKLLDTGGDLCVTNSDWLPGGPCADYDCDFSSSINDSLIWANHLGHCCGDGPCGPSCANTTFPNCLLICPLGDEVFTITVIDSCGNPICDTLGTYLDFSSCPTAIPCPGKHPAWPIVFPDSCDPVTGVHYFSVHAGSVCGPPCEAFIFVNGQLCNNVETRFLDLDASLCVDQADADVVLTGQPCADFNCDFSTDVGDLIVIAPHMDHCCPVESCDSDIDRLINGDFEGSFTPDGTGDEIPNSWSKFETRDPPENSFIGSAADNGPTLPGSQALHWIRGSNSSGDWTTMTQPTFGFSIASCSCSVLSLDIKVVSHSLGGSGTTSDDWEYPVTLRIDYIDTAGTSRYWQWGWFEWSDASTDPIPDHKPVGANGVVTGQQVTAGTWVANNWNLNTELVDPDNITEIRIGGAGWMFEGLADNLQLLVCKCCQGTRGDVNGDGFDLDIVDLTTIVDFLFGITPYIPCREEADVNGDGSNNSLPDIVDLTFNVDWLFGTTPTLVSCP